MAIQNTFYLDVDIKRDNYVDEPKVTQNDAVTFVLRMTDDGVDYPLAGVSTYTLASLRPDGQSVLTVGTLTGVNEITFELGTTEVSVPGNIKAAIQLYDADGRVSSIPFTYEVTKDIAVDYIPSAEEETLIQLVLGEGPAILNAAELVTAEANTFLANNVRKGEYDNAITYVEGNEVGYDGSSYVALGPTLGNLPTDATFWALRARKGTGDVNSVNGVRPDGNGDVTITIPDPDLSGLATKQELQVLDDGVSINSSKIEADLRVTQSNPTNFSGAIVSIIDDDARPNFKTVWEPILNANPNVKIGIAAVKDWTLDGSSLTLPELINLQSQGHDILCHSTHHEPSYIISPEDAELDYQEAKQWMKENGLMGHEYLVYPGGLSSSAVSIKDVARKHFKYAISTPAGGQFANTPVDNWCIGRMDGDISTIEELQQAVDYAKTNGIWLIIMTHSHNLLATGSAKMSSFINYVLSQSIPILPFSEAIKYKGNALALGEYTDNESMFVSVDGQTHRNLIAMETGNWQPVLEGSVVLGNNIYTDQFGAFSKFGNIVVASFEIRIEYGDLGTSLDGNLLISGLPFRPLATETTATGTLEYNILNLGTNYTSALVRTNGSVLKLFLIKSGNGVSTTYIKKSDIPENQPIVFRGQVTYRTT